MLILEVDIGNAPYINTLPFNESIICKGKQIIWYNVHWHSLYHKKFFYCVSLSRYFFRSRGFELRLLLNHSYLCCTSQYSLSNTPQMNESTRKKIINLFAIIICLDIWMFCRWISSTNVRTFLWNLLYF